LLLYKEPAQETAVCIDAAKAALPYEKPRLAPIEPQRTPHDHVPLAERLKAYPGVLLDVGTGTGSLAPDAMSRTFQSQIPRR
jgi:hypothetical protein